MKMSFRICRIFELRSTSFVRCVQCTTPARYKVLAHSGSVVTFAVARQFVAAAISVKCCDLLRLEQALDRSTFPLSISEGSTELRMYVHKSVCIS